MAKYKLKNDCVEAVAIDDGSCMVLGEEFGMHRILHIEQFNAIFEPVKYSYTEADPEETPGGFLMRAFTSFLDNATDNEKKAVAKQIDYIMEFRGERGEYSVDNGDRRDY